MNGLCSVHVSPHDISFRAPSGTRLLEALRQHGIYPESVCGGNGSCGKCTVTVNGEKKQACRYLIDGDIDVTIPEERKISEKASPVSSAFNFSGTASLAYDIGTTTVVCALLDSDGKEFARIGEQNPQTVYGADVISRIRAANSGAAQELAELIQGIMSGLAATLCGMAGISEERISNVSVAGNPAMQQIFLCMELKNLVALPYRRFINRVSFIKAFPYIPNLVNAEMTVIPDIAAYIGGDTLACILSTELHKSEKIKLIVDIGTNGELILGNRSRMLACATAAGPALEGAGIRFGMRGAAGAVDSFTFENGTPSFSVIGNCRPVGICGSGLIDAVAAFLDAGLIDRRGNITSADGVLHITDDIYLTQDDIRAFQTAKGAIAAGVDILAQEAGIEKHDITAVELAGAFGSHINPRSALRTGILPFEADADIVSVGNAACDGAVKLLRDSSLTAEADRICSCTETVELAAHPSFKKLFAKNMYFKT